MLAVPPGWPGGERMSGTISLRQSTTVTASMVQASRQDTTASIGARVRKAAAAPPNKNVTSALGWAGACIAIELRSKVADPAVQIEADRRSPPQPLRDQCGDVASSPIAAASKEAHA